MEIDYPKGFTKDNCVVISFGSKYSNKTNTGYSFGYHPNDSTGLLFGTNARDITLDTDKIRVWYQNISTSQVINFKFKVVLMKYEVTDDEYVLGDVNQDGTIDSEDVQMIQDYMMGETALTAQQVKASDMNENGEVDSADYMRLKNQLGL